NGNTIDSDLTGGDIKNPGNQLQQGRFTVSSETNQCHGFSRPDMQIDAASQIRLVGWSIVVSIPNISHDKLSGGMVHIDRPRIIRGAEGVRPRETIDRTFYCRGGSAG